MRGRKPKPTVMKGLHGTGRADRMNAHEPEAEPGLPACPPHLDAEATREWKRTGKQLVKERRMAKVYKAPLAAYCQAWSRWIEAETQLRTHGLVIKSPNGFLVQSPFLPIANRAMAQMMACVSELGISPTSQARVSTVGSSTQATDFEVFLGGKQ